jgi:hypothetical protein
MSMHLELLCNQFETVKGQLVAYARELSWTALAVFGVLGAGFCILTILACLGWKISLGIAGFFAVVIWALKTVIDAHT